MRAPIKLTHICVSKRIVIGSDSGLLAGRHQAIIWTNAGILSIEPLETNFSEIFIKIIIVSFKKMHLKVLSAIRWPFCLGLNVLINYLDWNTNPNQKKVKSNNRDIKEYMYKESILESQNFEDMSKDRDNIFWWGFPAPRPKESLRKEKGWPLMLATICDDTRNVLNMQHITPNLKRWDYSYILHGGT